MSTLPKSFCWMCGQLSMVDGICTNNNCSLGSTMSPNERRRQNSVNAAEKARRLREGRHVKKDPKSSQAPRKKSGGGWKVALLIMAGLFFYGAGIDDEPAVNSTTDAPAGAATASAAAPARAPTTPAPAPPPDDQQYPPYNLVGSPGSRQVEYAESGYYPLWGLCLNYERGSDEPGRIFRVAVNRDSIRSDIDLLPDKLHLHTRWLNDDNFRPHVHVSAEDGRRWWVPMKLLYAPVDVSHDDMSCGVDGYDIYDIPPSGNIKRWSPAGSVSLPDITEGVAPIPSSP